MKKIVEVMEVEGEGLESLLGKKVILFCLNYIYTGILTGVNKTCVILENPRIVYETGVLDAPDFKDAQKLPKQHYVMLSAIESFAETIKN